jgi:hypothetical protein
MDAVQSIVAISWSRVAAFDGCGGVSMRSVSDHGAW